MFRPCVARMHHKGPVVAVLWEGVFQFFKVGNRSFWGSGRPQGPRIPGQKVGGFAPDLFEGFPGPPGPARPHKCTPKNPARLLSGTQASESTAVPVLWSSAFNSFCFVGGVGVGSDIVDFGPLPGPTRPLGVWERPRPGRRLICTDFQPGRPILRSLRWGF